MEQIGVCILVGIPGIGKSTFVETSNGNAVLISSDKILDKKAEEEGITYNEAFKKYANMADKECKKAFREAIQSGKHVIVDRTSMTAKSRAKWFNIVDSMSLEHDVYFFAIDFEPPRTHEEVSLWMKNLESREKHVPYSSICRFLLQYEKPSVDEGFECVYSLPFYKDEENGS